MEVEKKQVEKAASALKAYIEKKDKQSDFLSEDPQIYLQFGFIKIPPGKAKITKVYLPHSEVKETANICVFVKDVDKGDAEVSVTHFTDLLQKNNVTCISEVIPLRTLKTEYKPYEAKRNLSNMFDEYLADERILRLLPDLLGKNFYGRKRFPKPINIQAKDLSKEINKALSMSQFSLSGQGNTCQVKVGRCDQQEKHIVENVMAVIAKLNEVVPGGGKNIRTMQLKSMDSPALKVYWSDECVENIELPKIKRNEVMDEPEDVTTVMEGKVLVTKYGKVHVINEENEHLPKGGLKQGAKRKLRKRNKSGTKEKVQKVERTTYDEDDSATPPTKRLKSSIEKPSPVVDSGKVMKRNKENTKEKMTPKHNEVKEVAKKASKRGKKEIKSAKIETAEGLKKQLQKSLKSEESAVRGDALSMEKPIKKKKTKQTVEKTSTHKSNVSRKVSKPKKLKKM